MRKSFWVSALAFVVSFVSWHVVGDHLFILRDLPVYVVATAAAVTAGVIAQVEWKLIERLYTFRVRTQLGVNMLNGRHPSAIDMRMLS